MPTLFNDHCKLSGWISDRNLTCPDTPRAVTVQIRSPHPSAGYNDSDDEQRCRTITMTTVKAPYLAAQRACLIKSRRVGRENSHPTGSSAFQWENKAAQTHTSHKHVSSHCSVGQSHPCEIFVLWEDSSEKLPDKWGVSQHPVIKVNK